MRVRTVATEESASVAITGRMRARFHLPELTAGPVTLLGPLDIRGTVTGVTIPASNFDVTAEAIVPILRAVFPVPLGNRHGFRFGLGLSPAVSAGAGTLNPYLQATADVEYQFREESLGFSLRVRAEGQMGGRFAEGRRDPFARLRAGLAGILTFPTDRGSQFFLEIELSPRFDWDPAQREFGPSFVGDFRLGITVP